MINANNVSGLTDNEVLENAINNRDADGIVRIPPRVSVMEPERNYWLLDRAILLPSNTTVILENCTIKLSDRCRDNFFRSANCGLGIADPKPMQNIHIRGEGRCILQGADHPRATGDSSMTLANPCPYELDELCRLATWLPEERRSPEKLQFWDAHEHSFGTDAGKEGESQRGDWRGIGILFARVEHFSIENIEIVEPHGWAISMEACAHGRVEKIHLEARMAKMIDGMLQNMENQDGVDVRNGCHHIVISDITGTTGDDMVALTAIAVDRERRGGSLCSTHVMHEDWLRRERDIHDIVIRNVVGYSAHRWQVRLLACNTHIWNVIIDGVISTFCDDMREDEHRGSILIGDHDSLWGHNYPDGISNVSISNVIADSRNAIRIIGYLKDSAITNVINRRADGNVVLVERENGVNNVKMTNV